MMFVLFETPSGFAIFHCCASLEGPDVLEVLWDSFAMKNSAPRLFWLKQVRTFEDKSAPLRKILVLMECLVNSQMIKKWHSPLMKLAVGKLEYKEIIEETLNIPCVHGPAVMELMWGIQNHMRTLVPRKKSQLTEADRLPISQGLRTVLSRYACVVKPEMVTELIVETASELFWCDSVEKRNSIPLRGAGHLINHVSSVNCEDWTLLKIATSLKAIWRPEEIGDSCERISEDEVSSFVKDRHKYEVYLDKWLCLGAYKDMMSSHDIRTNRTSLLKSLVEESKASRLAKPVAETIAAVNSFDVGSKGVSVDRLL